MSLAIHLAERRLLPDGLIRVGIRKLLAERLQNLEQHPKTTEEWVQDLQQRDLAENTEAANEQHYEVPASYFRDVLGPHLKYSCGYWDHNCDSLEQSEARMLELTCERADVQDGQRILELGCGWGSLSLWLATHYPKSQITAVSNSNSQRRYIELQARARGLTNLEIITCDINRFEPNDTFDRIVSVEMFEHVRNHQQLFSRLANWLKPEGKLFVHVFAHQKHCYLFEPHSSKDWMSRYFFTGGIMPSADLLPIAAAGLLREDARWEVNGQHYSKTLEAWLAKQDLREDKVKPNLTECYGPKTNLWVQRWRMFYMACSELFAYNKGNEWVVMHYRFSKPS
jgi:cyclopropane-fatty-acyl-phospholipid synthase